MTNRIMKFAGPVVVFGLAVVASLISVPESWSALSRRVFMNETGTVGCGICCARCEAGSPSAKVSAPGGVANGDDDYCKRSLAPVNYFTGENLYNTTDLSLQSFDNMSIARHYVATQGYEDKDALGPGWRFWDPRILDTGTKKLFVDGSRHSRSWTKGGAGVYTPDFFSTDVLKDSPSSHLYRDTDGNGITFYATDYVTDPNLQGRPYTSYSSSIVDGASTTYSYVLYTYWLTQAGTAMKGQISTKENFNWVSGAIDANNKTRFIYALTDLGGTIGGRITQITSQRIVAGVATVFRVINLSYYLTTTSNGPAGSLKQVDLLDGSSVVLQSKYYRYGTYSAGTNQIQLQYVVEGPSYERLKAVSPSNDVNQASIAQMDQYANYKFSYDGTFRCTGETVQGQTAGISFVASDNPLNPPDAVNTWKRKTVETLADTNQNIIYTNYLGQAVLEVFHQSSPVKEWKTWYLRDSAGRVIQKASAEAVTGFLESYNNLVDGDGGNLQFIDDANGLIEITNYAATTTATTTTAGNVAGYVSSRQVKKGELGTPATLESFLYKAHNSNNGGFVVTNYPIASMTVDPDDTGPLLPQTTTYTYTWYTTNGNITNRIESKTTANQAVTVANNGSNTSTTTVQYFDRFGKPTWFKDEDNFITVNTWDLVKQAKTRVVMDANTVTIGGGPGGWTTPPGGGLHLVTNFEIDHLSRTTRIQDPNLNDTYTVFKDATWEARTYPGWTGTATTGPIQVARIDKAGSYAERYTTSVAAASSGGKPTGTEVLDQTTLNGTTLFGLERTFEDSNGRSSNVDSYFTLGALNYSTSATIGVPGTNFYRTSFTYDSKGRLEKTIDWTGTIRKTLWDSRDRVESTWIGTLDANLIKTTENLYDEDVLSQPGIGNNKVTTGKLFTAAATSLNTTFKYDFRNRRTDSRSPQNVAVNRTFDNLNRVTFEQTYASSDFNYTVAELRAKRETRYDEKGQIYQTIVHNVNPVSGAIGNHLTTNLWSNGRGMTVKTKNPNGLFEKLQWDGAGRASASFTSYQDAESLYADASTVASDVVIQQVVSAYDAGGRLIQTTRYDRTNSTGKTGDLSSGWLVADSRRTFQAKWYDRANRATHIANYGTNGDVSFSRPGTAPEPNASDTILVTKLEYDFGGRQTKTTDNKGHPTVKSVDMLSRTTSSIENYFDGTLGNTKYAVDRTTLFGYDSSGRLTTITVKNPKGTVVEDQITKYVYGTTATPFRNDLLIAEIYPDSDDVESPLGNGTDATYDRVEYTYDYASRRLTWKLPLTTLHTYAYNTLGQLFTDKATTLGSGVDGAVRRIQYTYDDVSRPKTVSSWSAVSAGTKLNEVQLNYDGWGNEIKCEQGHEGTATGAPSFQKTFTDSGAAEAKFVRLTQLTYPNNRNVFRNFPTDLGVGDHLSRVDNLADSAAGTVKYAQYTYLGTGAVVKAARPAVTGGFNLDYGTGIGSPAGWDRFGRVIDQKWQNNALAIKDEYQYGYDRNSNRTFRDNLTATVKDEAYVYDGLDRVLTTKRGDLNAGRTDITGTPAYQEDWTFEGTGNTKQLIQTTSGAATLNQTRTHTKTNETTTIAASVGTNWGDGAVDRNGFMTRVPKPGAEGTRWRLTSDAWLRVVKVVDDVSPNATMAIYKYDGMHRRIAKLKPNVLNWDRRDYYYSCEWQVVEERELLNTPLQTTVATAARYQYVWDPRHVDALVVRDEDKNLDGDCTDAEPTDQHLYYAQDANMNVTALVNPSGTVVERVRYDTYGKSALFQIDWMTPQSSTLYNNEVLFAGYRLDPESALYQVRNRYYHPTLGRWVLRDRVLYHDGPNLYEYVHGNAPNSLDAMGLAGTGSPFGFGVNTFIAGQRWGEINILTTIATGEWFGTMIDGPASIMNGPNAWKAPPNSLMSQKWGGGNLQSLLTLMNGPTTGCSNYYYPKQCRVCVFAPKELISHSTTQTKDCNGTVREYAGNPEVRNSWDLFGVTGENRLKVDITVLTGPDINEAGSKWCKNYACSVCDCIHDKAKKIDRQYIYSAQGLNLGPTGNCNSVTGYLIKKCTGDSANVGWGENDILINEAYVDALESGGLPFGTP